MPPEVLNLFAQLGIGAVLFYLLDQQNKRLDAMQEKLDRVRQAQWDLIVSLLGEHRASQITRNPSDSSTSIPRPPIP